jgi:signal transduction histidine kinase
VDEVAREINPALAHLRFREKEEERFARLERAQRERLLFINSVAHELKTPLTAIMASGGLLQEELGQAGSPQQKRLVENMMSAATRLGARLNELLVAARSEKVGFTLKMELVDLRYLLQTVAAVVQPILENKRQQLILELPERVPLVKGDRQRLEQVVLNLLTNANKFTPAEGRVILRLREEKDRLAVEVSDNGPGIPAEDQAHIFEAYYRREADRERYPGLGLGLTVSKQLVEQHGGRIWLNSQPGLGSTFTFVIPLPGEGKSRGTAPPGEKT